MISAFTERVPWLQMAWHTQGTYKFFFFLQGRYFENVTVVLVKQKREISDMSISFSFLCAARSFCELRHGLRILYLALQESTVQVAAYLLALS